MQLKEHYSVKVNPGGKPGLRTTELVIFGPCSQGIDPVSPFSPPGVVNLSSSHPLTGKSDLYSPESLNPDFAKPGFVQRNPVHQIMDRGVSV